MVDPIAGVGGVFQTCLNFYFIYVYWKKYPRDIDIESDPEAPRPPVVDPDAPSQTAPPEPAPPQPAPNPEPQAVAPDVIEQAKPL